jgi:hypothetical protein
MRRLNIAEKEGGSGAPKVTYLIEVESVLARVIV